MPHRPEQFGTPSRIGPYTHHPEAEPGDHAPAAGCYLVTKTRCCHLIIEARPIAGDPNRLNLHCVRTDPDAMPADACQHGIEWDPRERRRRP